MSFDPQNGSGMDAGSFFWSFCWGCPGRQRTPQTPQMPVPAALSRPRGLTGIWGDTGRVHRARSGPRRAASERGVTPRGRAIAVRRLPPAARSYLRTSTDFSFTYFSRKSLAESQGRLGLSSSGRFPGTPAADKAPPLPALQNHSPVSAEPPWTAPARHKQLPRQGKEAPGAALELSSEGAGLASQTPTEGSPGSAAPRSGRDPGGCRAEGLESGDAWMPGCCYH